MVFEQPRGLLKLHQPPVLEGRFLLNEPLVLAIQDNEDERVGSRFAESFINGRVCNGRRTTWKGRRK